MRSGRNAIIFFESIAHLATLGTLVFAVYQFAETNKLNRESAERTANLEIRKIVLNDSLSRSIIIAEKEMEIFSKLEECIGAVSASKTKDKYYKDAVLEFNKTYYGSSNLFLPEDLSNELKILHGTMEDYNNDHTNRGTLVERADIFQKKLRILMTNLKILRSEF